MSDTPETLAAILAEMKRENRPYGISLERLHYYADRIEAAAKRRIASLNDALANCRKFAKKIERENEEGETRLDAEEIIATVDNEFAGIRPERATGNGVALREALRQISLALWGQIDPGCNDDCCAPKRELARLADAALAAPPRNCDRTKDAAEDLFKERFGRPWTQAEDELAAWLFAKAERKEADNA